MSIQTVRRSFAMLLSLALMTFLIRYRRTALGPLWLIVGPSLFVAVLGLVENSRGLVLATHNPGLMKFLCTNGLVLEKGRLVLYGAVRDALDYYANEHAGDAETGRLAAP